MIAPDLLGAVPAPLAARVRAQGRPRAYAAGQLIHGPAAPSGCLFRIEAGSVRFETQTRDGRVVGHAALGPGHWFGDIALMADAPPPHDAVAGEGTVLLVVPGSRFARLLGEDGQLAEALARLSSRRLLHAYAALDAMRSLPTDALIARYLLAERDADGTARLTQAALAERVGRARSVVAAVLAGWRRGGLVATRRGRIEVLDARALAGIADEEGEGL